MKKPAETKYNFECKAKDLCAGDKVRIPFCTGPFADAVIKKVDSQWVYIFRPYCPSPETLYSNGVIVYTGTEEFSILRDDTLFHVYERPVLK